MQSGVSDILSYLGPSYDYGVHPRHSPRTFPLELLAPRCLGLAHLLALPLCGAGARAPCCLGEGRNPSPSFASSRQGSTNRLSQPPFSFSYRLYVVSLSLLNFSKENDFSGKFWWAERSSAQGFTPFPTA